MKWKEILTGEEIEKIAIEHSSSAGVSGGWGGSYGATKASFQEAVEAGVQGVFDSGIPLERMGVIDKDESGFAGVLIYDADPTEKDLTKWADSYKPWTVAIARAVEITNFDIDLTPKRKTKVELFAYVGKKLAKINKLPRFPRSQNAAELRKRVIWQIGEMYWQEVFRRVQFDGEFLGMTFEQGLAHSLTEKNFVGWQHGDPGSYRSSYERRYFVYGKEFLAVTQGSWQSESQREWLCQSSTATKWSSILKHAKLQLVEEVQAA